MTEGWGSLRDRPQLTPRHSSSLHNLTEEQESSGARSLPDSTVQARNSVSLFPCVRTGSGRLALSRVFSEDFPALPYFCGFRPLVTAFSPADALPGSTSYIYNPSTLSERRLCFRPQESSVQPTVLTFRTRARP